MPRTLYRFIFDLSRRQQVIATLLSLAVAVLALAPLELQRQIVNDVVSARDTALLAVLSLLFLGAVLVHGGLKYGMNVLRGRIAEDSNCYLRRKIIEITGGRNAPRTGADDRRDDDGAVVSMISAEVEPLSGFVGESVSSPVKEAGTLLIIVGYMFWVEPLLALIGIGLFVPQLFFVQPMQRIINELAGERIETVRELSEAVVNRAEDSGARDAACLPFIDRIHALRMRIFRWKFAMKFLINLLEHLGTIGILFGGGWLVIQGETEIGTIVAFVSGLRGMGDPWRALILYFRQLTDALLKYDLIRDAMLEDRAS